VNATKASLTKEHFVGRTLQGKCDERRVW